MELKRDIRELTSRGGADVFGVAALAPVRDAVLAQGGESLTKLKSTPRLPDYP